MVGATCPAGQPMIFQPEPEFFAMSAPVDLKRLPSLNALRAFDCAARHGSFTLAAQELCVTPGAVSHQVKLLEGQLGRALFERLPNQLVLTTDGRNYLPAVRAAFALIEQATQTLVQPASQRRMIVATSPDFNARWLIPRLSRFLTQARQGGLQVDQSALLADVAQGAADVAIRWGSQPWPSLTCTRLAEEFRVAVCAPDKAGRWQRSDWADMPLLHVYDTSAWTEWLLRQNLAAASVAAALLPQARAGCVFNQESAAIHAAIAGQGAVLARSSLVVQSLRDRSLVLLSPHTLPLPEAYWLVSAPEGSATHPWCDDFKHWVLDEAERDLAYWRDALSTATTPTGAKADAA